MWTISLMLLARSLPTVTFRERNLLTLGATLMRRRLLITIELTRVQTNASREPKDEYAAVAVSVTDFQASTGAAGREERGRERMRGADAIGGAASACALPAARCPRLADHRRTGHRVGCDTRAADAIGAALPTAALPSRRFLPRETCSFVSLNFNESRYNVIAAGLDLTPPGVAPEGKDSNAISRSTRRLRFSCDILKLIRSFGERISRFPTER